LVHNITEPKTQLYISNMPSGVYLVKLVGEKRVQVGEFVKE
jgi:Lon protease-like protein